MPGAWEQAYRARILFLYPGSPSKSDAGIDEKSRESKTVLKQAFALNMGDPSSNLSRACRDACFKDSLTLAPNSSRFEPQTWRVLESCCQHSSETGGICAKSAPGVVQPRAARCMARCKMCSRRADAAHGPCPVTTAAPTVRRLDALFPASFLASAVALPPRPRPPAPLLWFYSAIYSQVLRPSRAGRHAARRATPRHGGVWPTVTCMVMGWATLGNALGGLFPRHVVAGAGAGKQEGG